MDRIVPNIYNYFDFKAFLKDYQEVMVKTDKKLTKSNICKKIGIPNTRSYFNDVINGRRPVTDYYIERFIDALELEDDQARYFRILVDYSQSEGECDKKFRYEQLWAYAQTYYRKVKMHNKKYCEKWYNSIIWIMIGWNEFKNNEEGYALIAEKSLIPITKKQIQEAIQLLLEYEFVTENNEGYLNIKHNYLHIEDPNLREYRKIHIAPQWNKIVGKVLKKIPKDDHHYENITFSATNDGYKKIMKSLDRFINELVFITKHDIKNEPENLFQFILNIFPITKDSSISKE